MKEKVSLADRVRAEVSGQPDVVEKRMFGSVGFMIRGKLSLSARESRIMFRIAPDMQNDLIKRDGCRPVVMRGHLMKGYVYVDIGALKTARALKYWVSLALARNKVITR
jgi:TfoX N-terminal domain